MGLTWNEFVMINRVFSKLWAEDSRYFLKCERRGSPAASAKNCIDFSARLSENS